MLINNSGASHRRGWPWSTPPFVLGRVEWEGEFLVLWRVARVLGVQRSSQVEDFREGDGWFSGFTGADE